MGVEPGADYGGSTVCGWASQPASARVMGVMLVCVLLAVQYRWAVPMPTDGIVVALDDEIQTLTPYSHYHKLNAIIDGLVHDQLFFRNPKTLRPVPNLAESLKAIDYLLHADTQSPHRKVFAWVKEAEVVDDLSLRLHAHRPVSSLPEVLTRLHVLPPQY